MLNHELHLVVAIRMAGGKGHKNEQIIIPIKEEREMGKGREGKGRNEQGDPGGKKEKKRGTLSNYIRRESM